MGRPGVCVGERQRWWHNQSGGGGGTGTQGSTETTKLAGGGSPAAFSMLEYWLLEDDVGHREFRRVYTSLPQTLNNATPTEEYYGIGLRTGRGITQFAQAETVAPQI
jgi:hypothetical protein